MDWTRTPRGAIGRSPEEGHPDGERASSQAQKRLMLCATALIAFLLATPLLVWDYVQRGRPHWATLVGLGALGGEQIVRLVIWRNETWLVAAGWIVRTLT